MLVSCECGVGVEMFLFISEQEKGALRMGGQAPRPLLLGRAGSLWLPTFWD